MHYRRSNKPEISCNSGKMAKKPIYEAPTVARLGKASELTKGEANSGPSDCSIPGLGTIGCS